MAARASTARPACGSPLTQAEAQLGGHPRRAVGTAGLLMDLDDQVAELDIGVGLRATRPDAGSRSTNIQPSIGTPARKNES